jgi:hypothetical protein
MHAKDIYNKNWKIPAARQQFSVRESISITARPRILKGTFAVRGTTCYIVGVGGSLLLWRLPGSARLSLKG